MVALKTQGARGQTKDLRQLRVAQGSPSPCEDPRLHGECNKTRMNMRICLCARAPKQKARGLFEPRRCRPKLLQPSTLGRSCILCFPHQPLRPMAGVGRDATSNRNDAKAGNPSRALCFRVPDPHRNNTGDKRQKTRRGGRATHVGVSGGVCVLRAATTARSRTARTTPYLRNTWPHTAPGMAAEAAAKN